MTAAGTEQNVMCRIFVLKSDRGVVPFSRWCVCVCERVCLRISAKLKLVRSIKYETLAQRQGLGGARGVNELLLTDATTDGPTTDRRSPKWLP